MEPHHGHGHEHHHPAGTGWEAAPPPLDTGTPAWDNQPTLAWNDQPATAWSDQSTAAPWPADDLAVSASGGEVPPAPADSAGGRTRTGYATAALTLSIVAVFLSLCAFGLPALAAAVLGVLHLRRAGRNGPGRRRAITAVGLGLALIVPSIVLSIGYWFLADPHQ